MTNRVFMTEPIKNPQIVRRTFEGLTNPEKNNDPVTSKYYTSQRYAVVCEQYGRRHVETFRTKGEAQRWIERNSVAHAL